MVVRQVVRVEAALERRVVLLDQDIIHGKDAESRGVLRRVWVHTPMSGFPGIELVDLVGSRRAELDEEQQQNGDGEGAGGVHDGGKNGIARCAPVSFASVDFHSLVDSRTALLQLYRVLRLLLVVYYWYHIMYVRHSIL